MAANFWQSSHCATWLVDRSRVSRSNPRDIEFFGNRDDVWLLRRYFMDVIHEVGVRLSLRQRVISTAQVLFKRFYLSASFSSFDPRLVAPTLLFVAAKVEECPLNAKVVIAKLNKLDAPVSSSSGTNPSHLGLGMPTAMLINASAPTAAAAAASATWSAAASSAGAVAASSSSSSSSKPPALPYLYSLEDLLEMEFAVMSGLGYDLIVYHPYRPLMQFVTDMHHPEVLQMAHEIVNDSYRLDLPLVHPPYLIAIAAIYIACNFQEKDYRPWFKKLNVEHEQILEISRELLQLWDDADSYAAPATNTRILALLCKLNAKKFGTLAQLNAAAAAAAARDATNRAPSASPSSTLTTPPPSARAGSASMTAQPAAAASAAAQSHERDAKRMRL